MLLLLQFKGLTAFLQASQSDLPHPWSEKRLDFVKILLNGLPPLSTTLNFHPRISSILSSSAFSRFASLLFFVAWIKIGVVTLDSFTVGFVLVISKWFFAWSEPRRSSHHFSQSSLHLPLALWTVEHGLHFLALLQFSLPLHTIAKLKEKAWEQQKIERKPSFKSIFMLTWSRELL